MNFVETTSVCHSGVLQSELIQTGVSCDEDDCGPPQTKDSARDQFSCWRDGVSMATTLLLLLLPNFFEDADG